MRFLFPHHCNTIRTNKLTNIQQSSLNNIDEPFGLGRFATDRCYAPHANGRYAALLLTKPLII